MAYTKYTRRPSGLETGKGEFAMGIALGMGSLVHSSIGQSLSC